MTDRETIASGGPDPTLPGAGVTWELDIEDEVIDDIALASLIFSSAAGQCRVDNFTPDALRAIADLLYDHANDMDGKEFFNPTGLKNQLAKAIPYIGVPQYAVPDGLVDELERAAGIDLPTEFDDDTDDSEECAA